MVTIINEGIAYGWQHDRKLFTVTTSGESHGPGMSAIIDGCPPGMSLCEEDIQEELERRKPGKSRFTSQRKEPDQVSIMSGVFEGAHDWNTNKFGG